VQEGWRKAKKLELVTRIERLTKRLQDVMDESWKLNRALSFKSIRERKKSMVGNWFRMSTFSIRAINKKLAKLKEEMSTL
jgi:hypothetical protein